METDEKDPASGAGPAESSTAAAASTTEVKAQEPAAAAEPDKKGEGAGADEGTRNPSYQSEELEMTGAERDEWLHTGKLPGKYKTVEDPAPGDKTGKSADDKSKTSPASEAVKEGAQGAAKDETRTKNRGAEPRLRQLGDQISQEIKKREAVKAETAELEKKRDALKAETSTAVKPAEKTEPDAGAPKPPKWADANGDLDAWEEAQAKYLKDAVAHERALADKETQKRIDDALAKDRKAREDAVTAERTKAEETALVEHMKTQVEAVAKRHPKDYDAAIFAEGLQVSPVMDQFIQTQPELGGEILYHLGKDFLEGGDLAERISKMGTVGAIKEMVKIEASIAAEIEREKNPPLPRATKPPTTVSGQNAAAKDALESALDADDPATYFREANRREIEARKAAL